VGGTARYHCRNATAGGSTCSMRFAAVEHICRPMQDGQNPPPLHEKATRRLSPHEPHRRRAKHQGLLGGGLGYLFLATQSSSEDIGRFFVQFT
jgi:hypothetical protein